MHKDQSLLVENATWLDVQHAIEQNILCLLPIGAICKEHGPHLPLNTDFVQAKWISERVSSEVPSIIWPVVSYGYYPAFTGYPGSWSISENAFRLAMLDIIESIAKHGSNSIAILNTGISTIKPLEKVIADSPFRDRLHLINVYSGKRVQTVINELEEQHAGGHADEIETSIMLAIDSEHVDMNKAEPGLENIKRGPLNKSNPDKPNYSPSGSMGNPTFASHNKGEKVLAAIIDDVIQELEKIEPL
ncbi:MAG: creatininase family protein [Pseudomonadota bacterium]